MKPDLEFALTHDGEQWLCRNDFFIASGKSMLELDMDIRRVLINCGNYEQGSQIKVFMGFDFDTIPTWLRQYHTHYFNRTVTIDL
ncbi:MAG: DUF5395 family protein [Thiohalomonadales bacterium]